MDIVAKSLEESDAWLASTSTRLTWITLLLLATEDGAVSETIARISHTARVNLAEAQSAIEELIDLDEIAICTDGEIEIVEPERFLSANSKKRRSARERQRKHRAAGKA